MRSIVVVGCTSGIGKALAEELLRRGNKVGGAARNKAVLMEMEKVHKGRFAGEVLDIRDRDQVPVKMKALVDRLGGMDVFIVSSSITGQNPDLEWETERNVLETNVFGYAEALVWAAHYFEGRSRGHLIGITSLAKYLGGKNPSYPASKAFEGRYLDGLRFRLEKKGITVTEIMPGFVKTPMTVDREKMFWAISAEKAAHCIVKAMEKKKRKAVISARWKPFYFILPHLPYWILKRVL